MADEDEVVVNEVEDEFEDETVEAIQRFLEMTPSAQVRNLGFRVSPL